MRPLLLSAAVAVPFLLSAQQLSWMESWPVQYTSNPGTASQVLAQGPGGELWNVRCSVGAFNYGIELYGEVMIDRLDAATGAVLLSCGLSDSVTVDAVVVDAEGNSYVAGSSIGDLQTCSGEVLANTSTGLWHVDLFLLSLAPDGTLRWSRDLTVTHPSASRVATLALDPNGDVWYGIGRFDAADLIRVDDQGADVETRTVDGVALLGTMDFDPWGGLYVTGASEEGGLTFGGESFPTDVNSGYQMFVLRYDPAGDAGFARFASDITFQRPSVVADGSGNAYLACNLLDSTSWDGIPLHGPTWVYDTFIAKLDSTGHFLWARESDPGDGTIEGDMRPAKGPCLGVDDAGRAYLMADVRGTVHWSDQVVSGEGTAPQASISITRFAPDGTAEWAANGASAQNGSYAQTLAVAPSGAVYFATHTASAFTFPPVTVNADGGQDAIVGKLSDLSTGIAGTHTASRFSIWPDPAADVVFVRSDAAMAMNAELLDAAGQRVRAWRVLPGVNTFDPAGLAPGLYLLRGADGGAVRVMKL